MVQGQVYDFVPGIENTMQTPNSILHFCPDGSVGITKFVGYHKLLEKEIKYFELMSGNTSE